MLKTRTKVAGSALSATLAAGVLMPTAASANVIFSDDFSGSTLHFMNTWTVESGAPAGTQALAADPLAHASIAGTSGGRAAFGESADTEIAADLGYTIGQNDGSYFVSYLFQSDGPATDGSNGPFRIFTVRDVAGTDYSFGAEPYFSGLLRNISSDTNDPDGPFDHTLFDGSANPVALGGSNTDVNLFVHRFTYDGNDFHVDAWLNPDDTTDFDAASNRLSADRSEAPVFDLIAFRAGAWHSGSGELHIDQVRVATSAPTLVPEPGSLALLGAGGILMMIRRRR